MAKTEEQQQLSDLFTDERIAGFYQVAAADRFVPGPDRVASGQVLGKLCVDVTEFLFYKGALSRVRDLKRVDVEWQSDANRYKVTMEFS